MTNKFLLNIVWILVIGLFSTVVFGQTKMTKADVENQLLGKWEFNENEDEPLKWEFFKNSILTYKCFKSKYAVVGKVITIEVDKLKTGIEKSKIPFLLKGNTLNIWSEGKKIPFTRASKNDSGKIQAETHIWNGGSNPPSFVGQWCDSIKNCFTFYKNGTYEYYDAGMAKVAARTKIEHDNEEGQWNVTATTLTVCSEDNEEESRTFSLEKRNHPQTGEPMLIIDEDEYVTTDKKRKPW